MIEDTVNKNIMKSTQEVNRLLGEETIAKASNDKEVTELELEDLTDDVGAVPSNATIDEVINATIDEVIDLTEKQSQEISELNETVGNSKDANLMRLRNTHSDLKKEFNKLTESHKKETETLRKDKMRLEEELRISVYENRNKDDEKTT